jgi:hypothetical protein
MDTGSRTTRLVICVLKIAATFHRASAVESQGWAARIADQRPS